MNFELIRQLGRSLFYAAAPALAVDRNGDVVDFNLAMGALAPLSLNGLRGVPLGKLRSQLEPLIVDGELFPEGRSVGDVLQCLLDVPGIGEVILRGRTFSFLDPASNLPAGRVYRWEVSQDGDSFHTRYRSFLDHELTWDTYARSYDRVLGIMPYYQEVVERHRSILLDSIAGPIVDLGAGTGNLVERLIGSGRDVTAVDSSRAMLDKLRSKPNLAEHLGRRLNVIEASIASLPMLPDGAFAGAGILLTLFDMDEPVSALETAARLVRPGGTVVVTELKRCFDVSPILLECENRLKRLGRYDELRDDLHRVVRSNRALDPGSRSAFRAEDVFNTLEKWQFRGMSLTDSHFGQCATIIGRKPETEGGLS